MSKSIRSYFTVTKKQTAKVADDDSDVIPESPDVQLKPKKKPSRKKRLIEDSDEEIFSSKKKKTDAAAQSTHQNQISPKLKEVTITDLFGNGKIKKTDALVTKETKKQTETGIHSDDEFEQSLLELDEVVDKSLKQDSIEILHTNCSNKIKINDNVENVVNHKSCENHETIKSIKINNHEETKSEYFEPKSSECKKKTSERKLGTSKSKSKEENKNNHEVIEIDDDSKPSDKSDDMTNKSHINDDNSHHNESEIDKKFNSSREYKKSKHIVSTKIKRNLSEFLGKDEYNEKSSKKKKHNSHHNESEIDKKFNSSRESKESKQIESTKIKRDLSKFLGKDEYNEKSSMKKEHDVSLNDSAFSDEDRHERKRLSAALYQKYLNRTGPKYLGTKEIPEGTPDCLKDCAFLLTGVLDSFERDEVVAAITKYGGTIKSGISKKVSHVLAGDDAGPAKTAKAEALGIPIINEDQFLDMITKLSNRNDKSKENSDKLTKPKIKIEKVSNDEKKTSPKHEKYKSKDMLKVKKEQSDSPKDNARVKKGRSVSPKANIKKEGLVSPKRHFSDKVKSESVNDDSVINGDIHEPKVGSTVPQSLMWVDKYKPQNIKQIIGQHGEASNVKKLINWLTKWYVNRKAKLAKPNPWAKNDDGAFYKAALLSGPPGVGKTTTVSLVCKELGFDTVEFNASDTRSKNLIKEQISELLSTTSLSGYARGATGKQAVTKKHVLVMDEVDGMAGNEDRGGLQELISLIKSTSVPIICMCNDRNSEKMRSLVNYCYDLRFSRPRVDQIKAAMMSICFKEGVKMPGDVLSQLISAAGQDVRQTLHLLSVWTADPALADRDRLQKEAQRVKKDIKMGPWEAIRKVFSAEEHKHMSIIDRSDLFFADYSLAPLFVHENYPQVVPHCPKHEVLDRMSKAVDSISLGDLVDSRIRSQQAWSLLPLQAMYSSVIPGQELAGHMAGQIQFPGWLGKNSRANKMARLAQSIHAHARLSTSGSKSSIFLDYAPHIRDAILNPLIKDKNEGISQSLQVLENYHLLREDLDSLIELSLWPGQRNPNVLIDAKVKAAMTRTYNKQACALPYAPGAIKRAKHHDTEEGLELGAEDEEVEHDSDPENDALIKKKKTKDVEKPSSSKEKSSKGGKGKKK